MRLSSGKTVRRHAADHAPAHAVCSANRRRGFTLPEVTTVLAVLVCLLAVAAPYLLTVWETARQQQCQDHLRTLGLALKNYHAEAKRFPPGQVAFNFKSNGVGRFADPDEAKAAAPGNSGASWVVSILPYIGQQSLSQGWKPAESVAANAQVAQVDIPMLQCPTRRGPLGVGGTSACERVVDSWRAGGNDYAACSGSGITFNDDARQTYALTNTEIRGTVIAGESPMTNYIKQRGPFGVNSKVTLEEISKADGLESVILLSERRVFDTTSPSAQRSSDGWAWGGPATLFSTRYGPHTGRNYDEADSAHPGLLNVCMADGRVRAVRWSIDLRTWNNLGNYQDGSVITHPDFRR